MARRRMSMRALSQQTGIPYGTLQGYLLDRHPMPARALAQIAEVLDVSADWLLFERPPKFDRACLAGAIEALDGTRSAALKVGQELSSLTMAQLLADLYASAYSQRQSSVQSGSFEEELAQMGIGLVVAPEAGPDDPDNSSGDG